MKENLRGTEFIYIDADGIEGEAFLVDYDIKKGITCYGNYYDEDIDAPPRELICLNRERFEKSHSKELYKEEYKLILEMIRQGVYYSPMVRSLYVCETEAMAPCAFK